jgi:hypothetical protein
LAIVGCGAGACCGSGSQPKMRVAHVKSTTRRGIGPRRDGDAFLDGDVRRRRGRKKKNEHMGLNGTRRAFLRMNGTGGVANGPASLGRRQSANANRRSGVRLSMTVFS